MPMPLPTAALMASFLALILTTFLALAPSKCRIANGLLAGFLLLTVIDISAWFAGSWWGGHPRIADLRPALAALQMPLFAGFFLFYLRPERGLRRMDALHLLPATVLLAMAMVGYRLPALRIFLEIQYLGYTGFAAMLLWDVRRALKGHLDKVSASWRLLALLLCASIVAHGFSVLRWLSAGAQTADTIELLQLVAALIVGAILTAIAFCALFAPGLFRGADRPLVAATRFASNKTAEDDVRLAQYMDTHRPYLDPELSLSRLARKSGISARELSELINRHHAVHFFDFINRYRIDHAKHLLTETDDGIADILFAAGFNTKSSFYTAFRKHTGMTPSAYRRQHGTSSVRLRETGRV